MARHIPQHIKELEAQKRLQAKFEAMNSTPPNMPAIPQSQQPAVQQPSQTSSRPMNRYRAGQSDSYGGTIAAGVWVIAIVQVIALLVGGYYLLKFEYSMYKLRQDIRQDIRQDMQNVQAGR